MSKNKPAATTQPTPPPPVQQQSFQQLYGQPFVTSVTPAQALELISHYHLSNTVVQHKNHLFTMLELALGNPRIQEWPVNEVSNFTYEFQQLCTLITATEALYA